MRCGRKHREHRRGIDIYKIIRDAEMPGSEAQRSDFITCVCIPLYLYGWERRCVWYTFTHYFLRPFWFVKHYKLNRLSSSPVGPFRTSTEGHLPEQPVKAGCALRSGWTLAKYVLQENVILPLRERLQSSQQGPEFGFFVSEHPYQEMFLA